MASVEFKGIAKRFDDVEVLKPLDLTIQDGEFLVLLGPSGCGKSTTLRMLAGLETPSEGRILIGDKDVTQLAPKDRDVAMVFQSYALYPHLTVRDNLAFGLKMRRAPKDEIEARVSDAASMLGLEAMLDRKPKALSGGQRQRVAMGRAIVRRPKVFLFDEPLSNLDAALRTQMRAEIAKLHQRLGITTVYVTHDQVEAMTLADRIAILNKGVLQQLGPPLSVYEQPHNAFVARFLGAPQMNLVEGEVLPGPRFKAARFEIELPKEAQAHANQRAFVGIRPQALLLDDGGPIEGAVELVEPMGAESYVRFALAEDATMTARVEGVPQLPIGVKKRFAVQTSALHLFERDDSGEAGRSLLC